MNTVEGLISDNYMWVPEVSDNVVPGLESLLTYLENQYVSLIAMTSAIHRSYELTMIEVEGSYVNKESISRYVNLNFELQWFPFISDDVVPGLKSILEYLELNYATIASLQNAITDMNNHIQTEIANIEFPTNPDGATKLNRHHYINYENNVVKKIHNHIYNKKNYYNFYNDTFNFKKS